MNHTPEASIAVIDLGCCKAIPILELGKTWIEGERKARWLPCALHASTQELLAALKAFIGAYKEADRFGEDVVTNALNVIRHAEGTR